MTLTNANTLLPPKTHILSNDHYMECHGIDSSRHSFRLRKGREKMVTCSWGHGVLLSFHKKREKSTRSWEDTKHINFRWLLRWLERGDTDDGTGTFLLENVASSTPVRFLVETLLKESEPLGRVSSGDSCVSRMKDKNNCFPQLHNPHWSKVM